MADDPETLRTPQTRPLVFGKVAPELPEQTPEAQQGLADELGIEIDNAIERPKD